MSVRPEDYDEIVTKINKKYEGDIRRGDDYVHAPRISTGSLELDIAMGGGIPMGRWTRCYGGYHSTKTLTALNIIREAQDMGLMCAYYNVEKQWDPKFAAEKIGLDTEEVTLVEGTSIEEIGDKMEALFHVCHLHIIDSCSIAVSDDELDADIRDWRPGISARAWGKVFRRLNERFDQLENTVILIDQVRTNFKTGGEDAPGGRILDHQSSMTVHFKKGSWLARNEDGYLDEKSSQKKGMSGQMEPEGIEIKARVEKSRVCRPFRTATMRLDFETMRFDTLFESAKAGVYYGVIETTGKGRFEHEGAKFHGMKQVCEHIAGNQELQNKIRETALIACNR